jgi:hypothetical protein
MFFPENLAPGQDSNPGSGGYNTNCGTPCQDNYVVRSYADGVLNQTYVVLITSLFTKLEGCGFNDGDRPVPVNNLEPSFLKLPP